GADRLLEVHGVPSFVVCGAAMIRSAARNTSRGGPAPGPAHRATNGPPGAARVRLCWPARQGRTERPMLKKIVWHLELGLLRRHMRGLHDQRLPPDSELTRSTRPAELH